MVYQLRFLIVAIAVLVPISQVMSADTGLYKVYAVIACDDSMTAWQHLGDRAEAALQSVTYDKRNVEAFLREGIPANRLVMNVLPLAEVTPDGILKALEQIKCGPNDVFFFYYSGHGAFLKLANEEGFAFTPVNPKPGFLRRSTVREKMLAAKPRLAVILSDCCSNVVDLSKAPPDTFDKFKLRNPPQLLSGLCDVLFNYRGIVDIVSSSEGEFSLCKSPSEGGYFTHHMLKYMREVRDEWHTWDEVVAQTRERVQADIDRMVQASGSPEQNQTVKGLELGSAPPRLGAWVKDESKGIIVQGVTKGSPGARAGLAPGDRILRMNGDQIRTLKDYINSVDKSSITMTIIVLRGGDQRELRVDLD